MSGRIGVVAGSTLPADRVAPGAEVERHEVEGADGTATTVEVLVADDLVVLPRHGRDEHVPAHLVDHHANVRALRSAGCDRVLSLCSVGALRADLPVGSIVVPDDVLALGVAPTFFDDRRGHRIPSFDDGWRAAVLDAWTRAADVAPVGHGTYAQTSGPRFETPAEVRLLGTFADVVGMTLAAELVLCVEAELACAAVCSVDNLANGVAGERLTFDGFASGVEANAERVASTLDAVVDDLRGRR